MHSLTIAVRVAHSESYHGASYSARFKCPTCGKSQRFNLNFLGDREIVCDGERAKAVHLTWKEAQAAGLL